MSMPQNIRDTDASNGGANATGASGNNGNVKDGMSLERLRNLLNVPPASRPPDWINPLEKIEQLLTCAICLDRYKNPKLLPCQHTFCMEPCLDGLIDLVRRLVRCPECRAEHPLPYDGVKAFQTNYTLMGFLEIHLQATEENASDLESYIRRYNMERCKVCDEKAEVDYCPHCEKRICLECKATHIDMLKRDLGRLMNQVKRVCTRISDSSDTLGRGVDSLTVNCENVKEEVRDYTRRYMKELKKREDALVAEVDAFYSGEQRMIKTVRDNLELESANINEACNRVDSCLKGDREMTDEDLVRYKLMFTDGLDYLRTVNPDADELTNKKIRFVVSDAHILPAAIVNFGELQVCTPQYSHKLVQAEQMYVPRFLQLGMESDNYPNKRRGWDLNDSSTWQQPAGGNKKPAAIVATSEEDAYSSRYRRRQVLEEQAWNRIRGDQQQQQQTPPVAVRRRSPRPAVDETGTSSRSPVQFDSSPWARVRMSEATSGSVTPVAPVALSPAPAIVQESPLLSPVVASTPKAKPAPKANATLKPPSIQESASTPQTSVTKTAAPRSSKSAAAVNAPVAKVNGSAADEHSMVTAGAPAAAETAPKGASEDRELDKRVANIRKEHEQRQQEQEQTILQIRQRVRGLSAPLDVSAAVTASSEDEDEDDDGHVGEAIPVLVYPKALSAPDHLQQYSRPLHVNTSNDAASTSDDNSHPNHQRTANQNASTRTHQRQSQQQPAPPENAAIDWKKYLIPSPPENANGSSRGQIGAGTGASGRRASAAGASSSAIGEMVQRSSAGTGDNTTTAGRLFDREYTRSSSRDSDSELSWNERRRRFVRSKTNPDFSIDTQSDIGANVTDTFRNRYYDNANDSSLGERRRRYGKNDSQGSQEGVPRDDHYGSSSANRDRETEQRKSRYRRKAERSHSAYVAGGQTGNAPNEDNGDNAYSHYHSTNSSGTDLRNADAAQRFEISIPNSNHGGSNTDQASAPGARFYRVFTNPKIDYLSKGRCVCKFGCKGNGDGQFNWPRGIAIVPTTEEIAVCDSSNHRMQIFDKRGRFLKTLGGYGSGRGEFDCLAGVCINKYRQYVVTDRYNHRVQIFDSNGRHLREFGAHGQTNGRFNSPWGVIVDQQGFIYVCDKDNHRVQIFQADGNFVGKFGGIGNREGQFQNPHFVACNKQNQLIVTDSSNHRVQVFDHNGHFLFTFGSEGFHDGQFKYPRGVAVDEQGFIVVADSGNNRIQVFYPDGRFYTSFGSWGSAEGQLKGVEGVAITMDGHIAVTDRENHRVQIF